MQQQFQNILQEQQKKFQEELNKIKQQISDGTKNTNVEYLNQIDLLNYELSQQKIINNVLQEKLKTIVPSQETDNTKIKLLDEKKEEILLQVETLKKKYNDTEEQLSLLQKLDESVSKKKDEILLAIKNNLEIYNSNDKLEIINLESTSKINNIYNHTISEKLNIITELELLNYSFPDVIYNITPSNNILYYSTNENNQIICPEDIFYQKRSNVKLLGLPIGNYTIENLIEIINKILNQDNIDIKLNGDSTITIGKLNQKDTTTPLTLYTDFSHYQNNILELFGFDDKQDCINSMEFTSKKPYDIRSDKTIQVYITNVSETQPLCKIMVGSHKISNFLKKLSTPLKNIEKLNIEFKDSKGRLVYFGNKNITLELSLKGISEKIPKLDTDSNDNKIQEKSLYDEINNLISL